VKKVLSIIGVLALLSVSCRGPLAKPGAMEQQITNPAPTGTAHMEVAKAGKEDLTIEKAEGGITIAELFSNKKDYSGKIVRIKGIVTIEGKVALDKDFGYGYSYPVLLEEAKIIQ
jgi:predicted RNA-binding protein